MLADLWALKHFQDIILSYPMTVFTYHAAVPELSETEALQVNLFTGLFLFRIFFLLFRYLQIWDNVVTDFIPTYTCWGGDKHQLHNLQFLFPELAVAQHTHDT